MWPGALSNDLDFDDPVVFSSGNALSISALIDPITCRCIEALDWSEAFLGGAYRFFSLDKGNAWPDPLRMAASIFFLIAAVFCACSLVAVGFTTLAIIFSFR